MIMRNVATNLAPSLRHHPGLAAVFKAAESRYLSEKELARYCEILPDYLNRAEVSREMSKIDALMVSRTVEEVFVYYPFSEFHEHADKKCIRDVSYVSAYIVLAMLMDDIKWLDDKFLLWMRTMVQAFNFPAQIEVKDQGPVYEYRSGAATTTARSIFETAKNMPRVTSSIYATYSILALNFRSELHPDYWQLVQPYFQQAINTLSAE